ncbi:2-hydroxychromene-2-carboxylate isomerase [Dyella subtropica]|uniref:2-hydroxychromene-2-carboxylate isomerase n=1 Tax=Dyella subtropica TaxID=2992127 RepID=UPI0022541E9F|nr:2-hydroxychromene-2-carboxylate isomerase [Dyella subtropica]
MIEFWFEFGSNYSYLSVMRIEELAASRGVAIAWRPFLLAPIFKSFGWETSPFVLQKEKGEYVWRDMARRCEKYGLPWQRPTTFPRRALLPIRVAMVGADQPWIGAYCKQIMLMNFAQDRDIDSVEAVSEALDKLGLPVADIMAAAQSEENKLNLRRQTEEAQARGIFGAPMFFVGSEMFWGDDRFEDALAFATR